jgi:hypothetical protein
MRARRSPAGGADGVRRRRGRAAAKGCTITLVDNPLRAMTFDVISVEFAPEASVTEHPVEQGFEVSDHIQVRAIRFTVEAWVTDSPLGTIPVPLAVQSAIAFLNGALGKLLTVAISGENTFQSMAIEGFVHRRTSEEGRGFSIRFKQIRVAQALSVMIPPSQPAAVAAAGAPDETDQGQQATTTGTPVSLLKDLSDALPSGLTNPVSAIRSLVGL